jgi:L-rhamnose isomerase/sugar isomerase
MIISQNIIDDHNAKQLAKHKTLFDFAKNETEGVESIIQRLIDFQVAIPSWALGTGGTRFGRFPGGGEPRSLEEKIEDVGLLHKLNKTY